MTKSNIPDIKSPEMATALAKANLSTLATAAASLNLLSPLGRTFDAFVTGKEQVQGAWVWEDEDEDDNSQLTISADGVAIVRIQGVLVPWERRWWYGSSICSTPDTTEALEQVREGFEGGSVKRLCLYIDSPGGIVQGMKACADMILAIRKAGCPVWAIGPQMCSCAYWLASQAGRVILAPDGQAACIGTIILAADSSKMMEGFGVEVNRITSTGAETYKGAGAYGTAITPEQKAMFARICDESQSLFNQSVATGRGITPAKAKGWADGQPWGSLNALAKGMIDEISDPLDALATLTDMALDIDAGPELCDDDTDDPNDDKTPDEDDVDAEGDDDMEARKSLFRLSQKRSGLPARGKSPGQSRTGGEGMTLNERILAAFKGGSETNDQKLAAAAQALADAQIELEATKSVLEATKNQLASVGAEASAYRAEVEAELSAAAIREFGAAEGPSLAAGFAGLPIATIKAKAAAWNASADKKFGTGGDAPKRQSAPGELPVAKDVDGSAHSGKAWDRLTPEQKAHAEKFSVKTDEAREAFAKRALGEA